MKVKVQYNKQVVPLDIPDPSCSVEALKLLISEKLSIPVEHQKLIARGHQLDNKSSTISDYSIADGTRLLLTITSPAVTKAARITKSSRFGPLSKDEYLTGSPHAEIIAKGPPPRAAKPFNLQMQKLPQEPIEVYDSKGDVVELSFETNALFIKRGNGNNNRVFYNEIETHHFQEIPNTGYYAFFIIATGMKQWFYFLPSQYVSIISSILRSQ